MRAGVVAQVIHTHALAHVRAARAIREAHAEQPHPAVGARPAVVAIEAAVRAPPAHLVMLQGCQLDDLARLLQRGKRKEKRAATEIRRDRAEYPKCNQIPTEKRGTYHAES